ncbi:hypothetical protein KUTeg_013513, partial [Tegillarca granosa]
MLQCVAEGHDIVALANLKPKDKVPFLLSDELDSYMYQTVGHHAIDLYAEAMGLPLYRHTIQGSSKETGRDYQPTPEDEVEDLYQLLKKIKEEIHIEAVSVGAILSDYQRVRVENVCQRLGLTSLAYLWRRNQTVLLNEMIQSGISAVIIKVAAMDAVQNCGEGWSLNQLVLVHLSVQDMSNFVAINSVYKEYFGLNPPARVCVQSHLPKNVALQIDCYGCQNKDRRVMHVQGLSHWAPANIGPYSQAVKNVTLIMSSLVFYIQDSPVT